MKQTLSARYNLYFMLILCLGCFFSLPGMVFAIDVEEVKWGFDSQSSQRKCIPLSLKLSNNTPDLFDELVQLNRLQYNGTKVGAPLCRKVYLAPYSSQWVQFYPYILDERNDEWSINWGPRFLNYRKFSRNAAKYEPAENTFSTVTRIVLTSSDSLSQKGSAFKRYPEELFPPSVTATDSLDEVILDHVPRWDAARKESFMDWLYQGGTLHLLNDPTGGNLDFTTGMASLNVPQDYFRVGAGLVIRYPQKLTQLTAKILLDRQQEIVAQELSLLDAPKTPAIPPTKQSGNNNQQDNYYYGDPNTKLLYALADMTQPEHNWAVIYLMTIFYIFLVFPGCYLFNKRQKQYHYRNSLLFLLITVAVFSTIFWSIGKRGYGEATTINSLMVARPLEGDQYDLMCWVNAFVTSGAEYQFTSPGSGVIFSTAQDTEKVQGAIFNGIDGAFLADIPPFSSRSFLYRIKAPFPKQEINVIESRIKDGRKLRTLLVEARTKLPGTIIKAQVLYDDQFYSLNQLEEDGRTYWRLGSEYTTVESLKQYLDVDRMLRARFNYSNEKKESEKQYAELYQPSLLRALDLNSPQEINGYQGNRERITLFLFFEIPEEFKLKTNVRGEQQGRILFAYDLPLPAIKSDKND